MGRYTFKVEDLPIEYLDQAPKPQQPRYGIARSEIKSNMSGNKPWMKFPLIVQGKYMPIIISHDSQTKLTKVQMDKYSATVEGKELNQDGLWPIVLNCTDFQLIVTVEYLSEGNIFEVKV